MHGLDELNLVRPSYYLEADELSEIQSNSLDFVIGNHILEHTDDPHSTLLEWFRVLRDKGILYLSIPNYRSNEYDFERQPLDLKHFVEAHFNRNSNYRQKHKIEHWREFVKLVDECEENSSEFDAIFKYYTESDNRIHFHVYDLKLLRELLSFLKSSHKLDFGIVDGFYFHYGFEMNGFEMILILKKRERDYFPNVFNELRNLVILICLSFYFYQKRSEFLLAQR